MSILSDYRHGEIIDGWYASYKRPEHFKEVLTINPFGKLDVAFYDKNKDRWATGGESVPVTYWIELPELPQKIKENSRDELFNVKGWYNEKHKKPEPFKEVLTFHSKYNIRVAHITDKNLWSNRGEYTTVSYWTELPEIPIRIKNKFLEVPLVGSLDIKQYRRECPKS